MTCKLLTCSMYQSFRLWVPGANHVFCSYTFWMDHHVVCELDSVGFELWNQIQIRLCFLKFEDWLVRLQITTGGYRTKHGQAFMFCPITSCCYLQSNLDDLDVPWLLSWAASPIDTLARNLASTVRWKKWWFILPELWLENLRLVSIFFFLHLPVVKSVKSWYRLINLVPSGIIELIYSNTISAWNSLPMAGSICKSIVNPQSSGTSTYRPHAWHYWCKL